MCVWKDFVNPLQLCFSGLTQISTWLLKDAVAQSCTGFAKTGCEGKGGMRAVERKPMASQPQMFADPFTGPGTTHGQ